MSTQIKLIIPLLDPDITKDDIIPATLDTAYITEDCCPVSPYISNKLFIIVPITS